MDRDTITALTVCVSVYRKLRAMGVYDMPLELKGLKGKAIKAAGNIDRLHRAYDAFNEAAPAHAADVEGLTPQIEGMGEDLHFATQVLGNSVNGSNASQEAAEPPTPPPAVQQPEPPKPAPEPPLPQQTPIPPGATPLVHTFRSEAEQQIAAGSKP